MASEGKGFGRLCVWLVVFLAIPIVPFVVAGESTEQRLTNWLDATLPPGTAAVLVIGLLATDVLLPVPSSVVTAFSGKALGFCGGLGAAWFGMTVGAVAAFGLVRILGRPLARRLTTEDELNRVDAMAARFGILVLVLARPIPILAEASVLFMGMTRLALGRFCLAVGLSNLGIAAVYAGLGSSVNWPMALVASIVLPLLAGGISRVLWPEAGRRMPMEAVDRRRCWFR